MNKEKIPAKVIAAIFATGILSFSGVIIETSMNIAFPTLMREFDLTTNTVSWLTSIYLLTISIIVPLSANLKTAFKTKHLFITANLLYLCGLIIGACAPSFAFLLIGRVVEGLGTGIALPLMFNIIMEQVPESRIGTMMGVGNMITGIAPAVGPTFGGVLVTKVGWRWIFYVMIPFIIVSLLLGMWGIEQKSQIRKIQFDYPSMGLIAIFFIGMIFGFSNLSTSAFFSLKVAGAFVLGLIALDLLIWRSEKIVDPILNLKLFKSHSFTAHVISYFLIQLMSLGNAFLIPNYIQLVHGNTAMVAGLVVLPAGFAGALMAPLGGRLYDKQGARKPILSGAFFMFLEIILFATLISRMNNFAIGLIYILYMGGMGMMMGVVMTDTLDPLSEKESPQGNAILSTVQQFAGAMGTSTTSAIVAFSQQRLNSKGAFATTLGSQHAYLFLTILIIILFILMWKYAQNKKTA